METTITTANIPVKLWLDDADEGTLKQAENLANHPYVFHHVALMPDAHTGYGMPIGGVVATLNHIIPNAVGVDIGCGMCAVKTNLLREQITKEKLTKIMCDIRRHIPLGFEHHKKAQDEKYMPEGFSVNNLYVVGREYASALKQLGTLGGGNHFIEVQYDEKKHIWLMLHSGSRNIGLKVAEHYNRLAKQLNSQLDKPVPPQYDLACLPLDTHEGKAYFSEMNYCVAFALANRLLMMKSIKEVLSSYFPSALYSDIINISHNYAAKEKHFGKTVVVHRKGATSAMVGETGIIPGSQGTPSYIVEGLGNPESFNSCSHGAGRRMSRNQAIKNLNLEEEISQLDKKGIIHALRHKKDLDEAASAYKDINRVMHLQQDLVTIRHKLLPLAVIKG